MRHRWTGLSLLAPAALLLGLVGLAGCERDEPIRGYVAPEEPPKVIQWTTPTHWRRMEAAKERYAGFIVRRDPPTVATVTVLPTSGLVPNVNRWRGQVGLGEASAEEIHEGVAHIDLPDVHVDAVDIIGPGHDPAGRPQRILAAMAERGGETWFFKLSGDAQVVGEHASEFGAWVRSVRFPVPLDATRVASAAPTTSPTAGPSPLGPMTPTGELPPGHPPIGPGHPPITAGPTPPAAAPSAPFKYKAPPGWTLDPRPRMMRTMTFPLGSGDKAGEATVVKLPKTGTGGLLENVNRWRTQVGLKAVTSVNENDIPRVTISGQPAMLFDYAGPEGAPVSRQIVAWLSRGDDAWFFKIVGHVETVTANHEAFKAFIGSIEFEK